MRWKPIGILLIILLLAGCTTSRYRRAEKYLKNRQYNNAIRTYLRILEPHMRGEKRYIYYDREAITGIASVYWQMQRYNTAGLILSSVIKKEPNYGQALYYLGMCFEGLANEDDAIRVFRRYPYVPPSDPYRNALIGRLDWNIRRKISREIQLALQNEEFLNLEDLPEKSVAVLYFISLSDDPQWRPLQKGLAEMMITDLSQIEELKVIERIRLNQLMAELRLSASGMIDEKNAPRMGKLLGVRNIVKGSYMVMPDLKMSVDAGIYESERIFLPTTANFEGNLSRLFQIEKELVLRVLDNFGIELTPQQRERILKIPTENMMAFMEYCNGLDALDRGNFESAQEFFLEAVRMDRNFQAAEDWIMPADMWAATHNRNFRRVNYEVAELIKSEKGKIDIIYVPPEKLISTRDRLLWMSAYQNAGFLPGNETRESFQEAELRGADVLPQILGEPPKPPTK